MNLDKLGTIIACIGVLLFFSVGFITGYNARTDQKNDKVKLDIPSNTIITDPDFKSFLDNNPGSNYYVLVPYRNVTIKLYAEVN